MLLSDLATEFDLDQPRLVEILRSNGMHPPHENVAIKETHVEQLRNLVRAALATNASVVTRHQDGPSTHQQQGTAGGTLDHRAIVGEKVQAPAILDHRQEPPVEFPPPDEFVTGTIRSITEQGHCFIQHELAPNGIYFRIREGGPPIERGDQVRFRVVDWNATPRPQASDLQVIGSDLYFGVITEWDESRGRLRPTGSDDLLPFNARTASISPKDLRKLAVGDTVSYSLSRTGQVVRLRKNFALLRFARMGNEAKHLRELATKALKERWDYPGSPRFHILRKYLYYTFSRLEYEDRERPAEDRKIRIARQQDRPDIAVFDTGLVNHLYQAIYAVFERLGGAVPGTPQWSLVGFCCRGEYINRTPYLAFLDTLPARAEYFDNPADLLYNPNIRLDLNYRHIIGDRSLRLPPTVRGRVPKDLSPDEAQQWLAEQIEKAQERAEARIRWNYKAAIPQYYEPAKHIQLLLPLCLEKADVVDVALAVQRKGAIYTAETILELDWAYSNARLITRPDSDWLAVRLLGGKSSEDEED